MDDYRLTSTGFGFSIIKKSHAITNPTKHFHSWWEILYIVSGNRSFFYKNRTFDIAEGTFICIPPGTLHRAINPIGESCVLFNVYFADNNVPLNLDNHRMDIIYPLLEKCEGIKSLEPEYQNYVKELLDKIGNEILMEYEYADSMSWSLLEQLLVTVVRHKENNLAILNINDNMNPLVSSVIDWINSHYTEDVTLPLVAEKFNITSSHLSRTFKKATRFTFIEYLNNLRISKSCRLLGSSNLSVLEIAYSCGFGSVTQFGRCFKSLTGRSPRDYKSSFKKVKL